MASSSGGGLHLAGECVAEIDRLVAHTYAISDKLNRHFEMVQEAQAIIQAQLNRLISEGAQFQNQLDHTHARLMALREMVETPPPPAAQAAPFGPGGLHPPPPPLGKAPPPPRPGVQTALVPVQSQGLPSGMTADDYFFHIDWPSAEGHRWPVAVDADWTTEVPPVSPVYPQNLPQVPLKPPPGTPKTSPGTPKKFAQVPKSSPRYFQNLPQIPLNLHQVHHCGKVYGVRPDMQPRWGRRALGHPKASLERNGLGQELRSVQRPSGYAQ